MSYEMPKVAVGWRIGGWVLAVGLAGGAVANTQWDEPDEVFCYADGLIAPDGSDYTRDPDRGCQWVDEGGDLVTRLPTGEPLCYRPDDAAVVSCDAPGIDTRRPGSPGRAVSGRR